MDQNLLHPMLFCKHFTNEVIPGKKYPSLDAIISFRSFDLEKDLSMIHQWVNMDYTRTFWQMRGSIGLLRACYQCIQQNPYSHSFMGLIDDKPICLFDIYKISADELSKHVQFSDHDCGFHLLMSPNHSPVSGLTITLTMAFLDFYFSQNPYGKMFAEPDIENTKSVKLLERSGFQKLNTVEMSYKTAHVYSTTKENFYAQNKIS
jgi:hypothetical protein